MKEFRAEFHALIAPLDVSPECVYNADQTGLYYQTKYTVRNLRNEHLQGQNR